MEESKASVHNKEEYPPMHTAEHLIGGAVVRICVGGSQEKYNETFCKSIFCHPFTISSINVGCRTHQ